MQSYLRASHLGHEIAGEKRKEKKEKKAPRYC